MNLYQTKNHFDATVTLSIQDLKDLVWCIDEGFQSNNFLIKDPAFTAMATERYTRFVKLYESLYKLKETLENKKEFANHIVKTLEQDGTFEKYRREAEESYMEWINGLRK